MMDWRGAFILYLYLSFLDVGKQVITTLVNTGENIRYGR